MEQLLDYIGPFSTNGADNAVLSAPKTKTQQFIKCKINLIKLKNDTLYQCESFTPTQAFHNNVSSDEIVAFILDQLETNFSQMDWLSEGYRHSIRISKKGKVLHSKKAVSDVIVAPKSHNRQKEYLLAEHESIPPLVDLGVFTKEGKIVASMYDKYKQINRFIELIDDVVKQNSSKTLNIIDFGCGKSYLTFIVYHYLNYIKKIPTTITGMDLKEQVIDDCNLIAKKYGYTMLTFIKGDIANYKPDKSIDMVITLHACDIATDLAIFHAINMGSQAILSVPCCQHELNGQIGADTNTIFTRYGLIKERFSALATDAIRGNLLELMGYHTQLLEFVDLTHSPKNILIRGIKNNKTSKQNKSSASPEQLKQEIMQFMEEYNVTPTLYTLLKDRL